MNIFAFIFPFLAIFLPSLSLAQSLNFAQDDWRFPPTEIDGTPIMRDGNTIEIPRCNDGDINSSCTLTFSLLSGGFILDVQESYFTDEIGSSYTFNLTIGQIVIPVVYLAGNPLTPVCNVDLTLQATNGTYIFNGISDCPTDIVVPENVVAAMEWIKAPEGVTRERDTTFVTVGPEVSSTGNTGEWTLANPGDTVTVVTGE